MNATTKNNSISLDKKLTVDTQGLMELLSCGRSTALAIAEEAEARIYHGKRILFNVEKVREYVNKVAA